MTVYEPGTVAVATVRGVPNVRIFRSGCPSHMGWEFNHPDSKGRTWAADGAYHITDIRPLVVLDLSDSPRGADNNYPMWLQQSADCDEVNTRPINYRPDFLRWLADQIEAQTKPPRIPEPGKYAVVEAMVDGMDARREFCRLESDAEGWSGAGAWFYWRDLLDPVLIRDGIEDGAS